jgi:uncharacterized OB-fold protein
MTSEYKKPLPRVTLNPDTSRPFWDGAKKHELWIQYCLNHNGHFFYPREVCPECLAPQDRLVWQRVEPRGRVHSYTTVYQPGVPAFADDAPFIHALIELDAGARIVGNVVGLSREELEGNALQLNEPVEAVFEDVTDEWTLVKWRRTGG